MRIGQEKKPVIQANVVTSARENLTRDQRRLLYLFMRETHLHGWPQGGEYVVSHRLYATVFRVSEQEARDDLRRAITALKGKVVRFYEDWDGESADVEIDWTTKRKVAIKRGLYSFVINNELREYLQPLAYNLPFTVMDLGDLSGLRSKWSQKLYEALCQFRVTGIWHVSLESLRERWVLPQSYNKINLLFQRVIEPSMKEVKKIFVFKELTCIRVRRRGSRKVTSLAFHFTPFDKSTL